MLQLVEIYRSDRRTLRRGVEMNVEVIASAWDLPRKHRILDMSDRGLRVASGTRLPVGEDVVVSFTPPGWWIFGELTLFARVRRETQRLGDGRPATMGMEFIDLPKGLRIELKHSLRGLPPVVPSGPRPVRRELAWVDVSMMFTEDLGDRVNTFEVCERLHTIDDHQLAPVALGSLLTGSQAPYRWRH